MEFNRFAQMSYLRGRRVNESATIATDVIHAGSVTLGKQKLIAKPSWSHNSVLIVILITVILS